MRPGPRGACAVERPNAALSDQGGTWRSSNRWGFPLRPGPRHHHLPRSLDDHLSSQTADQHAAPRRRRPGSRGASGRAKSPRSAQGAIAPPAPRVTRTQAEYDPRPVTFDSLDLEPTLIESIRQRGFLTTTPIQSAVVPIIMNGDDLIGCADTGTGKTAAFLLPILNRLLKTRAAAPE